MDDPLTLLGAALALLLLAAVSTRLRWLTAAGSAAAAVLGFGAVVAFGWAGLAALLAPFLCATLLGKAPGGMPDTGARTLVQVAANGLPALAGAAIAWAGARGDGLAAFLGALSALGADTIATEVGMRWGGVPRSIATWRPLSPGASGGVSALGLLASAGGAFLAPLAFHAVSALPTRALLLASAAGFLGGLVDSLLGAALQRKGACPACGATIEDRTHCGVEVPPLRGRLRFLDNDAVNLANGIAAGAIAVVLWRS